MVMVSPIGDALSGDANVDTFTGVRDVLAGTYWYLRGQARNNICSANSASVSTDVSSICNPPSIVVIVGNEQVGGVSRGCANAVHSQRVRDDGRRPRCRRGHGRLGGAGYEGRSEGRGGQDEVVVVTSYSTFYTRAPLCTAPSSWSFLG